MDRIEKNKNINEKQLENFINELDSLDAYLLKHSEVDDIKKSLIELFKRNEYEKMSVSNIPENIATIDDKKKLIDIEVSNKIFNKRNFIILNIICWLACFVAIFTLSSTIQYKVEVEKFLSEYKADTESQFEEFKEEALKENQLTYDEAYVLGIQENSIHWNNVLNHIHSNIDLCLDLDNDIANQYLLLSLDDKIKEYSTGEFSTRLREAYDDATNISVELEEKKEALTGLKTSELPYSTLEVGYTTDVNAFVKGTELDLYAYTESIVSKLSYLDKTERDKVFDYISVLTAYCFYDSVDKEIAVEWLTLSDDLKVQDALDGNNYYSLIVSSLEDLE